MPSSAPPAPRPWIDHAATVLFVAGVVALGAWLRFAELGTRSLWHDEFCTWHVFRLPLAESLAWAPEIIPPLYQFVLRIISDHPHPPEWVLRFPAALCGLLVIPSAWWLGSLSGRRGIGLAAALLVATCPSGIEYSQEARGYSMLLLGSTLSMGLWYQLVRSGRSRYVAGYAIVTALTFHAHYLVVLVVVAQIGWALLASSVHHGANRWKPQLAAILLLGALCLPLLIHRLSLPDLEAGLTWVGPTSFRRTLAVLADATYGSAWLAVVLASICVLAVTAVLPRRWNDGPTNHDTAPHQTHNATKRKPTVDSGHNEIAAGTDSGGRRATSVATMAACILRFVRSRCDYATMLVLWLLCSWLGLVLISWTVQPALVMRYALPASIPAILLPLVVVAGVHRAAPMVLALVFVLATAPEWIAQARAFDPGFRELTAYLQDNTDPSSCGIVLAADGAVDPEWTQTERLALEYYPIGDRNVEEWVVDEMHGKPSDNTIVRDPRELHVIVFRAGAAEALTRAGRRLVPYTVDGVKFSRLLFAPYRLIRVAPLEKDDSGADSQ